MVPVVVELAIGRDPHDATKKHSEDTAILSSMVGLLSPEETRGGRNAPVSQRASRRS